MDKDFYISTYNSITKTIWVLLLTTLVIECYLIQRSFDVNSIIKEKVFNLDAQYSDDPVRLGEIIGTSLHQGQTQSFGLRVNYGTLTIIWPIVLFTFFLIINYLLRKKLTLLRILLIDFPDFKIQLLSLNVFSLLLSSKKERNVIVIGCLVIMPIIGLLFHAYSGYSMIDLIGKSITEANESAPGNIDTPKITNQLIALFGIQIFISLTMLFIILYVNVKSGRIIKTSANISIANSGA